MTNINWQLAEEEILSSGMVMKLIDDKWCMLREGSDTIYYDAPTKEALISAYFHDDLEDFEELPEKIWPVTIQSLPLLNEPDTMPDRRLCLRQLDKSKFVVCKYHEQDDEFVQGHYFRTLVDAQEYYNGEVARYTSHWQELVDKFYELDRSR